MATLFTPDGRTKEVRPSNGTQWTFAELSFFVGGYWEVLRTVDGGFMVTNELAKLIDPPLELNYPATRLYIHGRRDVILGSALVVDSRDELPTRAV